MENRSKMGELQMRRIVSKYQLGELLGKGAYSEVFKARHLENGNIFAVKVISNKVLVDNQKVKECINNELSIHNILEPGPYIVRFHQLLQTKNNCYFVYEFCEGGTLHDLLRKEGALEQKKALSIFFQLVAGLKVLRKHNIMHRDLKPENVLIKEGNFKLADFGFCKELGTETMTRTMLGSPLYMAPEVLRGQAYSVNADIWSVGVMLFQMLYGFCPYQSNSIATLISVIQEKPLYFDPAYNVSPNTKRLIAKCLQKDCRHRIPWDQFFEEVNQLSGSNSQKLIKEEPTINTSSQPPSKQLAHFLQTPSVLEKNIGKIKQLHSTMNSFDELHKRSGTPGKSSNEMKSKFEIFKENYHKYTPSEVKHDQLFVKMDNMQSKIERSRSISRNEHKDKNKEGKIQYKQLITQHQNCLTALKACMNIMECRERKQVIQVGAVLRGIRKVLERIYTRINLEDAEMLPVLSMVKYEMIQVDKMQMEIEKWAGAISQEPEIAELPKSLSQPWAVLSTYC